MNGSEHMYGPLVALAAGGTAGHVFPAEALAVELSKRGCRLILITDRRGGDLDGRLGEIETHRIRAGGIAGKSWFNRLISVVEIGVGTLQAMRLLRRLSPTVVIGFGGYASVPTMMAASRSAAKTAIHEQNAVLGRANRLLAPRVERIATSFEKVAALPEAGDIKVTQTGMPVRQRVTKLRGTPYPVLDQDSQINILVFGGSQGAAALSSVVPAAMGLLSENLKSRLRLVQQCRAEDIGAVNAAYEKTGIKAELASFFEDLPEKIAAAHLVICRSGASTIAELTTIGRPAILVPYPHAIDDHQTNNGYAVDEAGGGWQMPEDVFTPDALAERLSSLLSMPRILQTAAEASRKSGRPDAAIRLADMVFELLSTNGNSNNLPDAAPDMESEAA